MNKNHYKVLQEMNERGARLLNSEIPGVNIPDAQMGEWKVEKFTVSEEDARFFNLRCFMHRDFDRMIVPGTYTKLTYRDFIIMSDTPAEKRDHLGIVKRARGRILINGLGLGVVLQAILLKPEVYKVDVVEISEEVIWLVAPYIGDERVTIYHADAFTWKPPKGVRYNVIWHDIWYTLSEDNLSEMKKLHRRYGRKCDWQGSWGRDCLKSRR